MTTTGTTDQVNPETEGELHSMQFVESGIFNVCEKPVSKELKMSLFHTILRAKCQHEYIHMRNLTSLLSTLKE